MVLSLVLLGWCAVTSLEASLYQAHQSQRLDRMLRDLRSFFNPSGLGSKGAEAARAEAVRSGLVGRIEVPRLGLGAIVAEGIDSSTLRRAVGHVPGSAFPGERGNVALSAHRDSFFATLRDLREGDAIRLSTPDGIFDYSVDSIRIVEPRQVEVLESGRAAELTLITCYPFHYIGPAPSRFVARATLRATAAASRVAKTSRRG